MKKFTRDDTEHGKEYYLASDVDNLLAQPEHSAPHGEPVATLDDLEQEIYENTRQFVSRDVMEWMLKRYYTTPTQPQSEAQGLSQSKPLTDEQIDAIADKFTVHTGEMWEPELCIEFNDSCKSVHSFARAIEAAHGITKEDT